MACDIDMSCDNQSTVGYGGSDTVALTHTEAMQLTMWTTWLMYSIEALMLKGLP